MSYFDVSVFSQLALLFVGKDIKVFKKYKPACNFLYGSLQHGISNFLILKNAKEEEGRLNVLVISGIF